MTPLPKRRQSHGRSRRRRSHHHLTRTRLIECSNCHNMRLPHRVCPTCGYYKGEAVVAIGE